MELLTHSRMSSFKTCRRKHYYEYEARLRPDRISTPLRFGQRFHRGLEVWDLTGDQEAVVDEIRRLYEERPTWEDETDWDVEGETCCRLVLGHIWYYGEDRFRVMATEQTFRYSIYTDVDAAGKIDRIVELPDGRVAIQEYKTAGEDISPDSDYWTRLQLDQQISHYFIGAQQLGFPVETIIYDATRKPGISPRKPTKAELTLAVAEQKWFRESMEIRVDCERETPQMYGARLSVDLVQRPEFYFQRMEIPRLDSDIEEYKAELSQIRGAINTARRYGHWFRNTTACVHPYRCPYLGMCKAGFKPGDPIPDGFAVVDEIHPELGDFNGNGTDNQTESGATRPIAASGPAAEATAAAD